LSKWPRIALRNLARNRRRTLLSLVAVVIGVAAMVTFEGFVNGQRTMLLDNILNGQLGALQVHRKGYVENVQGLPLELDFADTPELRAKIAGVPGVTALSPRITFGAMLSTPDADDAPGRSAFLVITATEPASDARVCPKRAEWVAQGRLLSSDDAREVVLNTDFAADVGLEVADDDQAAAEEGWPALLASDRDGALNGEAVLVVGTLLSATAGDRKVGLMPLESAQRLLRMEGRVVEYALAVSDLERVKELRERLAAELGAEFEVHAWQDLLPFLPEIMGRQDFLLGLVGIIFLVIVLLGIVNAMLMNVLERVREIGTMMAVGTRRRQIAALFVWEGVLLGAAGGLVGAALGAALVWALHRQGIELAFPGTSVPSVVRPYVSPAFLARAAGIALLGSGLSALWPALRASRLRPIDALRSS
jgi:putative ABC transport system permease protein